MRYLAIDAGGKRTGLAMGDDLMRIASPVDVIEASEEGHRFRLLLEAVAEHEPDALVLGLPLNMDGSEGPASAAMRRLAQQLGQATGLVVHLVDERLSSHAAEQGLRDRGLSHRDKRRRRDALAAAVILKDFLDRA